jgi:hypothetical protein
MLMTVTTSLVALFAVLSGAHDAVAGDLQASPKPSPTSAHAPIYQEFVQACISAFSTSAGTEEPSGKIICECTAEESKHQGVTIRELKLETGKISKDPKYKIENKKLLAAIQYCTILSMEEKEHQDEAPAQKR